MVKITVTCLNMKIVANTATAGVVSHYLANR